MMRVEEEKDLGVLFSSTFSKIYSHHVKKTVQKTNQLLGLIKRAFSFLEPQMLRNPYTAPIRSHLDYELESLSIRKHKDIGINTKKCN